MTTMKKTIHYATGNAGKFAEVKRFVEGHPLRRSAPQGERDWFTLEQLNVELFERQTLDQKAIALEKAQQAYDIIKQPVLVDDGGIYFDAYNQFPGTLSKFIFDGIGYDGLLKLIQENNRATFRLQLVYMDSKDHYKMFEGTCSGIIVRPKKFDAHPRLPYDAIFKPDGSEKTYAQLRGTDDEHKFAYRLRAFKKFLDWYHTRKQ